MMNSLHRGSRSVSPTLGQLMGGVAAAAAFLALIATVRALSEQDYQVYLIAGCVISYVVYLFFLILISFECFSRSQILLLLAATGAMAALLIQAVAQSTGWVVLASILALPILPFIIGGLMLHHNQSTAPAEDGHVETETLTTLVRSKRLRGLTPQEAPAGDVLTAQQVRLATKWQVLMIGLIVVLALVVIDVTHRRLVFVRKSQEHAREEMRCREEALVLTQLIEDIENQGPPTEAALRSIEKYRRLEAEWTRKAEQHARKSRDFAGRWRIPPDE